MVRVHPSTQKVGSEAVMMFNWVKARKRVRSSVKACISSSETPKDPKPTFYFGRVPEWLTEQIANLSSRKGCVGSNPTSSADCVA